MTKRACADSVRQIFRGDVLETVDGVAVTDLDHAVRLVTGPAGSCVTLMIVRYQARER